MAAIMQPIIGCGDFKVTSLFDHPNAPRIENPTANQQAALDGYWKGVFRNADLIVAIQKYNPAYMPGFEEIILD